MVFNVSTPIKKIVFALFILAFCSGSMVLGMVWYALQHPILTMNHVHVQLTKKPSLVFDRNGHEIARFQLDSREFVSITRVPEHVIKAFIAAEDWNFFNHTGLSFKGIVRSTLVNLYHGKKMQGASTITQQLVKLHFFDGKKTFIRKFKEQFYALLIEKQYSKEQILEYYLNSVYFGSGVYGIQAAAKKFWNKNIEEISVDEAALLAAIICSPGNYFPVRYPLSAQKRRNVILRKMKKLGFITDELCTSLERIPVTVVGKTGATQDLLALPLREYIRSFIEEKYGKDALYNNGLTIQTTLDATLQKQAESVIKEHAKKLRQKYGGDLDGGLISVDAHTGEIRALIAGFDVESTYFNRPFQAKRQQGSVFKPLLYAAAVESGISLCDIAVDEPLSVNFNGQIWEPRNHTRTFVGSMTLARALVYSNNIISVKVLLTIGAQKIVDLAKKCHLTGDIMPYPSLALGCLDSTLVEVAGMFNIFANNGVYVEPHLIMWIKDDQDKKIYKSNSVSDRVISSKVSGQIGKALTIGLSKKRHLSKKWIDSDAMGKTGTTNDSRTCWFVGSTPEITTAVYVGCDDNRPMGYKVFPLYTSFPIWLDFHTSVTAKQKHFVYDSSLQPIYIDSKTGEFFDTPSHSEIYSLLV